MSKETAGFVNSKLKQRYYKPCPDMQRSLFYSNYCNCTLKKEQTSGRFQELNMSRTHELLRM